jgi:MFS transporter, OFA family, oxalate/formate antiporter
MMFLSYTLCGALLLLTIFAGHMHQEILFVCAAILAIFFWASLFALFPITVGHYFGETAAGSNYGVLYAIAKGSGGFYGGILSTLLISQYRLSVASGAAAGMAILAGLIVIPLRLNPPIWREAH